MSALHEIRRELGDCQRCSLASGRKRLCFGAGPQLAEVLVLVGAPRAADEEAGTLFAGDDRATFEAMIGNVLELMREEVYVVPLVKCRPEQAANAEQLAACRPWWERQLVAVGPRLVLVLGAQAVSALWPGQGTVGSLRGHWRSVCGVSARVSHHPAYLLRHPEAKAEANVDLVAVRDRLEELRRVEQAQPDQSVRRSRMAQSSAQTRVQDLVRRNLALQEQVSDLRRRLSRAERPSPPPPAPPPPPPPPPPAVPEEVWKDLMHLCHPDRHGAGEQAERATRATRWLIEHRRK